jgi:hypothetical protein
MADPSNEMRWPNSQASPLPFGGIPPTSLPAQGQVDSQMKSRWILQGTTTAP